MFDGGGGDLEAEVAGEDGRGVGALDPGAADGAEEVGFEEGFVVVGEAAVADEVAAVVALEDLAADGGVEAAADGLAQERGDPAVDEGALDALNRGLGGMPGAVLENAADDAGKISRQSLADVFLVPLLQKLPVLRITDCLPLEG